jgi:hypothetical protein|tara:strand:+ start:210 stop:350 length:141 start_codon:yes stop_codon:yes gene_type:complete
MEIKKTYCDSRVMYLYISAVAFAIGLQGSYITILIRSYRKDKKGNR